jgi:XTP/dITP diphosphohydrolase
MTRRVVLASNNAKKLAELHALLAPLGWDVQSQSAFGVGEAEEPHATFIENALAKARFATQATGLSAIADDSGIVVRSLNGAPGVISAHYAGLPKSDANNNALLLKNMQNIADRRAHFFSCVVLMRHAQDPQPIIAQGAWYGEILHAPRGTGGFGYDPLFYDPVQQLGAGEMPPELKNQLSHRGRAIAQLIAQLQNF